MSVRRRELAAVLAHVREGVSVELRGSWGSGRSTLLRGVEQAARDEGFGTLSVSGEFALRAHALEALGVAGVRSASAGGASAISARVEALTGWALARPALILVDDAAVVDPESWGVISAVRRRTDVPVVYALDAHAPEGSGALHVLECRVARVALEALRYEEVRALLEDVLGGGVDAHTAGRVFSKSGGLPRLVVAVGETGRQHGILREQAGSWHAGDDLWHPALAPHITEILYPLTASLREGLEMLALAGIVTIDRGVRLIGSPVLEQLEARGLVTVFRNGVRVMVAVNPPLIAEYYRHQSISARRVRLVERVASDRGEREAGPAVDAPRAELPARALPSRVLPAALEWEAVRNPAVARLMTEHRQAEAARALDAWRRHPGLHAALALADALGRDAGAERIAHDVLRDSDYIEGEQRANLALLAHRVNIAVRDGGEGELARVLSEARSYLPGSADAIEVIGLEAEVRAHGFSAGSEQLVRELIDRAGVGSAGVGVGGGGDEDGDAELGAAGAGAAGAAGAGAAEGQAAGGAMAEYGAARVDEAAVALAEVVQAKGWFARALRLVEMPDEPVDESVHWRRRRRRVTVLALFGVGRIDEALRRAAEWRDAALADLDADALRDQAYVCALALVHTGRNAEADDAIGAALALGEPGAESADVYGAILVLGAIVAARRGALDVAETLTVQARRWLPHVSSLPLAAAEFAEAQSAHARGDDDRSRRLLAAAQADFSRRGFAVQAAIAEIMALESVSDAARVVRSAALEGELFGPLLDYLRGVGGAEADWIERAGDRLRAANQAVHAAGAYLRAADAYRLAGRAGDADRADQLAQALGGTLDADVLWHVHAQAASRPALTQREQEITALAAVGASNHTIASRLSVSVRTVENHLNRAFRKLGISRRDELESVRALWSSHPDA
jgi:DNA-binding CsgD family transcriptional regulator